MVLHHKGCAKQPGSHSLLQRGTVHIALSLALLSGLASTLPAQVAAGKADRFVSRVLAAPSGSGWSSVIIKSQGDLTPVQQAQLQALRADTYRHLPIVHSIAVRVPTRNLAALADLPFVTHLSTDTQVKKTDEFTVEHTGADIAFQQYALTGAGVTVAVVDSGIHHHKDFSGEQNGSHGQRILDDVVFLSHGGDKEDRCGHGTHVAGILAGNGAASTGKDFFRTFYGIARKANLVSVRVLGDDGQGNVSDVIAGIQWVIANKDKDNIRIINLSLGHPVGESYTTDPLCQAVESAWKAGIVVVCAAGNEGRLNDTSTDGLDNEGFGTAYGSIQCPGNDPYVITVGAMKNLDGKRSDDTIATYSSRGPTRLDLTLKPDLVAPGNQVISLDVHDGFLDKNYGATNHIRHTAYMHTHDKNVSDTYFEMSGTSMAAPVVAGAAALLLQAHPDLTPDTVKARLMISADKWTDPSGSTDPCTYGAGYLNIPAALQCTVVASQSALSPTLSQDSQGNVYINMDRALWGTRAIWGTGITDLRAVWGTRAIWGCSDNILDASHAIWGKSVWTDTEVWSDDSSAVDLSSTAIHGD